MQINESEFLNMRPPCGRGHYLEEQGQQIIINIYGKLKEEEFEKEGLPSEEKSWLRGCSRGRFSLTVLNVNLLEIIKKKEFKAT